MSDRSPLVSVCIPTRDRARWLGGALESVFAQTLQDFEVIVFDDASRDGTEQIVARWSDPRLSYRLHARPVGVATNRNACLAVARGRYVAWLDSDDRYRPHMLEAQSTRLDAAPDVALVHGGCDIIDAAGDPLPDWTAPFAGDAVEPGPEAFRELALQNYVAAPTVMVRRRAHDAAGPYRASLRSGEDWDMWLRIALHGDLAYTADRVAQYRWHRGSLTRAAEADGSHVARDRRILAGVFTAHRDRIPAADGVELRARAAVAARGIQHVTDLVLRRRRVAALRGALRALRAYPALAHGGAGRRLLWSAARADEYRWHTESRARLRELADVLAGSRIGERLRRQVQPAPEWQATLRQIAHTVRDVVPRDDAVAVVDKWDPTLLHLARRRGWHFPDRRMMPEGYPPDSDTAVRHLEELRLRGARHLVVPCSAFWWLDSYAGLARHLEVSGEREWQDERCVIYRLGSGASCAA